MKKRILMSGGSGLLGKTMLAADDSLDAPLHSEMDVTEINSVENAINKYQPDIFLHLAAFTSPPKVENDPLTAVNVNIIGTANIVSACIRKRVRMVYVSTDYVFKGERGLYKEDDELLPQNKYAWSKLGGECAVRLYDNALIIRTSFIQDIFPYEKAFVDQYTSRDKVSVIAPLILKLTQSDECGIIHVGTERKSVFDLAKQTRPAVEMLYRNEVSFSVPQDTSLNITKLSSLQL